jgi:polar amino acid transport system substrate-binding protein
VKRLSLAFVSLVILGSMLLSACSTGSSTKIRVASDATWPPFEIVDEKTKEITGFDIDMMKAIGKSQNLDFEFINVGFDPLLAGIAQCQYDAAVSSITITDDRKKTMLFSDPYLNAGQVVTVKIDSAIENKEGLAGKTVGAQIGTTGAIEIGKITGAVLKTYDTLDLAIQDLMNGQIDAVVADYPTAVAFVAKNSDKLKTVGGPFTDEYYGIAVCNKNTDLLNKINAGLKVVKDDGTMAKLEEKYLKAK